MKLAEIMIVHKVLLLQINLILLIFNVLTAIIKLNIKLR